MRTRVPILITAFVGVFMILKFFLANAVIEGVSNELEQWGVVTLAFAIILGVLNLAKINLKAVVERKKDWGYKLLLVVSMFGMMVAGGFKWYLDAKVSDANTAFETAAAAQSKAPSPKAEAAVAQGAQQQRGRENGCR